MEVSNSWFVHNKLATYDIWSFVLSFRLSNILYHYCRILTFKNFRTYVRYACCNDHADKDIENFTIKKGISLKKPGFKWNISSLNKGISCYYNSQLQGRLRSLDLNFGRSSP